MKVTLLDPLDFVAPVVLRYFVEDGYRRSPVEAIRVERFAASGNAVISGARGRQTRFLWSLACHLSEVEAVRLDNLIEIQNLRYGLGQDGHLLLADECELLSGVLSPFKSLVSGSEVEIDGLTAGYGIFKVKLQSAEDSPRTHAGRTSGGVYIKLCQFDAIELPEVV
jgi:hypothetical protein